MYAIKPWGSVLLIGGTVSSYAMGIGMCWRESNATIVEKKSSPSYEPGLQRRCVLTDQTVKLLVDLGCTEWKLKTLLKPARGWKFVSPQLDVLRESTTFPGCAVGESAYHCTEGALQRVLRTEFLRFGGTIQWATEAYDAFESNDGTDTWCLRKDFGLGSGAEAVIATAKQTALTSMLVENDPDRIAVLFDTHVGVSPLASLDRERLFGSFCDVSIVVGAGMAMHCWLLDESTCSWRVIQKATQKVNESLVLDADDLVNKIVQTATRRASCVSVVPATVPAIKDSASHFRISVLGDGLLPVDPFEWRADKCRCAVEEAAALCRAFYGKKYHRGDVPFLLRSIEQDSLSKRSNLLRRDLQDAEHFLAVHPALGSEPSEPQMQRVGV